MPRHFLFLAAVAAVFLIAAPAKAGGDILGCGADQTYEQCISQTPGGDGTGTGTSSTICTNVYGCLWCDLTADLGTSVCTRHQYSWGYCQCRTRGLVGRNRYTGAQAPLCETLTGSCRYV